MRKPVAIKLVNLEDGLPTVAQARLRLDFELAQARREKQVALKLIHGYGSSGVGGELRTALQATLRRALRDKKLRAFIPGEQWRISDEQTWELLKKYPEWKQDRDLGRGNQGISIVLL